MSETIWHPLQYKVIYSTSDFGKRRAEDEWFTFQGIKFHYRFMVIDGIEYDLDLIKRTGTRCTVEDMISGFGLFPYDSVSRSRDWVRKDTLMGRDCDIYMMEKKPDREIVWL
ncbi:MAG TPA: hypothetical protein VFH95_15355, partial [Candidatus Kapabacteria bacterium]|nr:hypothetical protein [Candidatus Kapabacteria bacterium]